MGYVGHIAESPKPRDWISRAVSQRPCAFDTSLKWWLQLVIGHGDFKKLHGASQGILYSTIELRIASASSLSSSSSSSSSSSLPPPSSSWRSAKEKVQPFSHSSRQIACQSADALPTKNRNFVDWIHERQKTLAKVGSLLWLVDSRQKFQSTPKIGMSTHWSSITGQDYDISCGSKPVDLHSYWEGGYPKTTITNRDTQTVVQLINFWLTNWDSWNF